MCGIVGILSFEKSNFKITGNYINRLRDTMVHRGPDGAGTWINKNNKIGLGHRRLSIIDLSEAANQPMSNEDGSLVVCFNGEIYNYLEIRQELELKGKYVWKTDHSDTEVILHAFEEWGIGCLDKFRGMFAIALWDEKKQELWLIRDRIGIKPLYYSIHHNRLVFASEIKAILEDTEQRREINENGFYHYLSFLTVPAPETLFSGIKKLSPGTWLQIKKNGQVKEHRYWDALDNVSPLINIPEQEIIEKILAELRISVKLRKISDVPVGVFLSGGIDSSLNAALFSEEEKTPVKTFTIGYDKNYHTYQNEIQYAKIMAKKVQAEYYEKILNVDDFINFLPRMIWLQDEPLGDPVCMPLYYISKLARDNGVTVCQVGEGSDELFGGYPVWEKIIYLQKLNELPIPKLFKEIGLNSLKILGKERSHYYEWLRRGINNQPIFWGGTDAMVENEKQKLLSPRLRKKFKNFTSWEVIEPIYQRFKEKSWEQSPLSWMSYFDLNLRLPELMLMRVDKMSMGVSLEGRVPFLDHKFVELIMSIPESIKFKRGKPKYLLKRAVKGIIPDELINRKKQGFHVPVYEWFFEKLGEKTRQELNNFCNQADFLDKNEVKNFIKNGRGTQTWYLLNLALWWKKFFT